MARKKPSYPKYIDNRLHLHYWSETKPGWSINVPLILSPVDQGDEPGANHPYLWEGYYNGEKISVSVPRGYGAHAYEKSSNFPVGVDMHHTTLNHQLEEELKRVLGYLD